MRKNLLSFCCLLLCAIGYSQATYYWVGGTASASWTTASNWNTALNGSGTNRTTPNYQDTLVFDGSNLGGATPITGAASINNIKTDTIASLRLQNGAIITFLNTHAANANLAGTWARAAAATGIVVNTTNGSNVFACANTANVKVGAVITAPSSAVNAGVTYVTSVTPNVSFTTNLPALATATGTSLTVCQPNTWTGTEALEVGDIVCTGTNTSIEQVISKVDNATYFCVGSGQPQQAVTSATTMKRVSPLKLTGSVNALYVSENSSLTINNAVTSRPLVLYLMPGANGTVEGTIELDVVGNNFNTGRIYVAPTGGAQLVFKSGSIFKSGDLQYPFGAIANSDNNNVLFESGSQAWYGLAAGTPVNCIFGANYPKSVVKFNRGSLYVHNGGADRFTGYTFREFPNVTSNVDLTLFQPGIVDSIFIPAGRTINHSAGNTIALKGTFNNNGTFGITNAANGPLLSFVGDGTYNQGLDLLGSGGTGVVNYNTAAPTNGGSFQRIIVAADAIVNLQNNLLIQTYGQTTVWGKLNFGNSVINNHSTAGVSLSVKAPAVAPTVAVQYDATNSNTLVLDSVSNFLPGMLISGTGIPANTYIVTSASAGKIVWLTNPVSVLAGTIVTASANTTGATLATENAGGISASYALAGTSTYGLPTSAPGVNYVFNAATTTPFPAANTVINSRNVTLGANVSSNVTELKIHNTLDVNSNTLTVPVSDTVHIVSGNAVVGSSNTKYVVLESATSTSDRGYLRIGNINASTLFPVGTATSYLPVTVTPYSAGEDYSVNVFNGLTDDALPNGTATSATEKAKMVDAVWQVSNNFTPTGSASLQFHWPTDLEGSSFTSFADSQIGISRYVTTWGGISGSGSNSTNLANGLFNEFGAFRISANLGTLPVKFGDINATMTGNSQSTIIWYVFAEVDIVKYIIEHSADGRSFSDKGAVFANGSNSYAFQDGKMFAGANYYRLKAVEKSGKVIYSNIINLNTKQSNSVAVYPNPLLNKVVRLSINNTVNQEYVVALFDVVGRKVFESKVKHTSGVGVYSMKLPENVQSGVYKMSIISSEGQLQTLNVIVQ